jgi:hypothetical protein
MFVAQDVSAEMIPVVLKQKFDEIFQMYLEGLITYDEVKSKIIFAMESIVEEVP